MPCNVVTGKAYRGGNSVWLASVAERRAYSDERWGTYKQVQGLGGQVRRGEKGSAILFWQFETRKMARDRDGQPILDGEGKPVYETAPLDRPWSYPYTVFNAEQCDGLPRRETPRDANSWNPTEEAERALAQTVGDDREFRQEPGLLRPAPGPHHPAVQAPVSVRSRLLPDRAARAGALDRAP